MEEEKESTFAELNAVNVSDKTEKKNDLTYLSWAWAWQELKKRYPDATSTVYENKDGWIYHTDGRTAWVKCGVTVNGLEQIEILPVMNYSNKSIPVKDLTSVDVNKSIQRCITKAIARHGLGLYIYAGEDLPENEQQEQAAQPPQKIIPGQVAMLSAVYGDRLPHLLETRGLASLSDMSYTDAAILCDTLEKRAKAKAERQAKEAEQNGQEDA